MRLNKFLAEAGVESRRKVEEYILAGRITVNGTVVRELSTDVNPEKDVVLFDGERVVVAEKVYLMLNKPEGIVTTTKDELGRPTVYDLMPHLSKRVAAVGRLDVDTAGMLLLTNDGDLAHRLSHPSYELGKRYKVIVKGRVTPEQRQKLESGVWLSEGKTSPAQVRIVDSGAEFSILEMVIHEGFNRQIRRMCAKVGLKVKMLSRVAIGPLDMGDLPIGKMRFLTEDEVALLRDAVKRRKPPTKLTRNRSNLQKGKQRGRPPAAPPPSQKGPRRPLRRGPK
ncbi:MAG: pseudouridine synthase [Planctomycetota bacterium]